MAHLLGEVPTAGVEAALSPFPASPARAGRLEVLEGKVTALRAELAELRAAFEAFKGQF
ncbi:MAG TPA: hypothetical protein VF768_08090 [Holophagaceae bacterium]